MKNLKLTALEADELSKKAMNNINGGKYTACGCGCAYATQGGSSTGDNGHANLSGGLSSNTANDTLFMEFGLPD
jgi:natural product precursor